MQQSIITSSSEGSSLPSKVSFPSIPPMRWVTLNFMAIISFHLPCFTTCIWPPQKWNQWKYSSVTCFSDHWDHPCSQVQCSSVWLVWNSTAGINHSIYPVDCWRILGFFPGFFPFLPITSNAVMTFLHPSSGTHVKDFSRVMCLGWKGPKRSYGTAGCAELFTEAVVPIHSQVCWQLIYLEWLRGKNRSTMKFSNCISK